MKKGIKNSGILLIVLIALFFFSGCGNTSNSSDVETVELTISAAASLTDALKEIEQAYETENQTVNLNFNFGSSGTLKQQFEQGAPADLFLSASARYMEELVEAQFIDQDQQKSLLRNEIVVIAPTDGATVEQMTDLTNEEVTYVTIGIPESVPAGRYAKEALESTDLWDALQSKMVQGKDVRQVLQYVETGNADAGFVYKTDALTSEKIKVAFAVDAKSYTPVEYPIGIIKNSQYLKEAEDFFEYLQSEDALNIFIKYGFSVPE